MLLISARSALVLFTPCVYSMRSHPRMAKHMDTEALPIAKLVLCFTRARCGLRTAADLQQLERFLVRTVHIGYLLSDTVSIEDKVSKGQTTKLELYDI
jgi:hypothetical protein